jgi:hypothetical protein
MAVHRGTAVRYGMAVHPKKYLCSTVGHGWLYGGVLMLHAIDWFKRCMFTVLNWPA